MPIDPKYLGKVLTPIAAELVEKEMWPELERRFPTGNIEQGHINNWLIEEIARQRARLTALEQRPIGDPRLDPIK